MLSLPYKIILGSKSPRRQELLKGLDISFEIRVIETEETFSLAMPSREVPEFLAIEKGKAHLPFMDEEELIITSDTLVICENEILGKPKDREHAVEMLHKLSGKQHEVITGVCLTTSKKTISFSDTTKVFFKQLTEEQICYYVDKYKPFDKAGSYGIQEWIGYTGISSVEGSYFNVMGLPVSKLFDVLQKEFQR